MEGLPGFQTNNILKIVTVFRYFFMAVVVIGFIVTSFENPLASYFPERRLDILLRNFFMCEAGFWALKYKRLTTATGQK